MQYQEFEDSAKQDLIYRVQNSLMPTLTQGMNFVATILRYILELGGIFYFLIQSGSWWVFPISILLSIPSFHFNKKRVVHARNVWSGDNADMRYSDYLHGTLVNRQSAKERKLFQFMPTLSDRWDTIFKKYNKHKIREYILSSLSTGTAMAFSMSNILIFGAFMLWPLKQGTITIGLYVSLLQMISNRFNMSINTLIREFANVTKMKFFVKDIKEFNTLQTIKTSEKRAHVTFESIRFENVSFCYPGTDAYILKGVSFEIYKGMSCALIGLNGAGKTTITKLILGLYKPTSGQIYVNDADITSYSYEQLRDIFVCMQQKLANYKLSARENIALYQLDKKMDDSLLDAVLERCQSENLMARFNHDYDTLLTNELDDGVSLSGGEWQKVAMARTILSNRDFIILDEPTASLDPLAEVEFYKNYKELLGDKTCLYITHRLGSTYLFDQCYVLHDGKIVESGSHEELVNIPCGFYSELYRKQKDWYMLQPDEGGV